MLLKISLIYKLKACVIYSQQIIITKKNVSLPIYYIFFKHHFSHFLLNLFSFSTLVKRLHMLNFLSFNKLSYAYFFLNFMSWYASKLFSFSFYFNIKFLDLNFFYQKNQKLYSWLETRLLILITKWKLSINTSYFLNVLFFFFIFKDTTCFAYFLKDLFKRNSLNSHKQLIKSIHTFFFLYFKHFFTFFNVLGISLTLSGKISATGSAKKKRYTFSIGECSLSNFRLKTSYFFLPIFTTQGSLGLKLFLFFN